MKAINAADEGTHCAGSQTILKCFRDKYAMRQL
jgi:hypothetical protein